MKSIFVRTAAVFVVASIAVMGLFSAAQAQSTYVPTDPARGATYMPPDSTRLDGAFGFGSTNPIAGAVPTATPGATDGTGGTGGGLALTGSETDLPAAIAVGLMVLGGTAVVYSRKRQDV